MSDANEDSRESQPVDLAAILLDTAGVAKMIKRSVSRVVQLDETLRPFRLGKTRVYLRAAVERYLAAREAGLA